MRALLVLLALLLSADAFAQAPSLADTEHHAQIAASVDPAAAARLFISTSTPTAASTPAVLAPDLPREVQVSRARIRRGRRILAAGLGLIAGGASAAWFLQGYCYNDVRAKTPIVLGSLAAFAGAVLTLHGALQLGRRSPEQRAATRASGKRIAALSLAPFGFAALTFGHVTAFSMPEIAICGSS
jgi:hypothetical protein